jgi:hypothetical protein
MMRSLSKWLLAGLVSISLGMVQMPAASKASASDGLLAIKSDIKTSLNQGIEFLRHSQKDGKWLNHPGVTALCLQAMFESHRQYNEKDGPWIREPMEYLLSVQQDDGAIYDPK